MGNRKWWFFLNCILFCVLLGGCKDVTTTPVVPLQEIWTEHKTEETVCAYILDEEGNLYTLEADFTIHGEQDTGRQEMFTQMSLEEIMQLTLEELEELQPEEEDCFFLRKYNAKGEQIYSKALGAELASYVKTMAVKDGIVYFVPYITGETYAVLYSYCPETEELVVVKELPYFKSVSRIIPMEDCFYLLGTNVEGYGSGDSRKYVYSGEKIFCYNVSEDKLIELGVEEPMDICAAEEGKLCIYAHMGEEFCLLLYDTSRESMELLKKTKEYKMSQVAFCSDQQAVIYAVADRGLVLSYLSDLEVESELYPGDISVLNNNVCCVNGNVACRITQGCILQFPLADVKCENKILRYISAEMVGSDPFGCGYEIQRNTLTMDKFALKVMALDKDFDVCCVNSSGSFGYNMRENGVFYPLNEIEGIQEYLDACFPYVREAATDRDGNIWMIPFEVDIPGVIVKKDATDDGLLKRNMTYEEYCLAYEALSEEEKKWAEPPATYAEQFIIQYILERGTIDTEEFRNILQRMAKNNGVQNEGTGDLYCRIFEENDYRAYYALQYGTDATIYAEPKLTSAGKNVGYCQFLAVNPYSDNLEETLQYIATLVAYIMEKEEAPLFFANREVEDNSYDRSLYELYRKGVITFSVDEDVYEGYSEVLDGKMSTEEFVAETETKVKIFLNE